MKNLKSFGILVAIAWLVILLPMLIGCTQMSMERTNTDGTVVVFRSANLFQNSTMSKLAVDNKTAQTYSGLKIGALENDTATEAIKAMGEAFGNAAATAIKKSVVP